MYQVMDLANHICQLEGLSWPLEGPLFCGRVSALFFFVCLGRSSISEVHSFAPNLKVDLPIGWEWLGICMLTSAHHNMSRLLSREISVQTLNGRTTHSGLQGTEKHKVCNTFSNCMGYGIFSHIFHWQTDTGYSTVQFCRCKLFSGMPLFQNLFQSSLYNMHLCSMSVTITKISVAPEVNISLTRVLQFLSEFLSISCIPTLYLSTTKGAV